MTHIMYQLTGKGKLACTRLDTRSPEAQVLHFLNFHHRATRDAIYEKTSADIGTLAILTSRGYIEKC